jgi:cobalt/nickel transport system permease protein
MADALLSPEVGGALWVATGATIAVASRKLKRRMEPHHVPMMGVMGAFVFAAQMINFTIPATGSSGHFAGGMLLSILLGPHAAFLTIASVLVVQGLFFADGGLLAMGANIFNMGFVACYLVYPLLYRPLAGSQAGPARRRFAVWLGAVAALQLGALGVVMETKASGIAELPIGSFLAAMQPIHLAIGVVEGLITVAVIEFVTRAEPGLLAALGPVTRPTPSPFPRRALAGLGILAIVGGGFVSWFASAHPDGLEWSIARLTGEPELITRDDAAHRAAARIQEKSAILPDYSFPAAEREKAAPGENDESAWGGPDAGTTVSGLVGGGLTLLIAGLAGWLLRRRSSGAATPAG